MLHHGPRIAVVAVGTRGDVLPLLALAIALHEGLPCLTTTLITHRAHQEWLQQPAQVAGLQLHLISSAVQAARASEESHREQLIRGCEEALACRLDCPEPAGPGRRLIIFNLFALEAFHLAEALGADCMGASPCLVPYAPPASFARRFQAAHPALHEQLQASGSTAHVSWSDVRAWLWPIFLERWGAWRHHRLGLPAVPYSRGPLPPPPPLLYGVSTFVVPRPGHWPAAAHLCGSWSSLSCFPASQQQLPPSLVATCFPHLAAQRHQAAMPCAAAATVERPAVPPHTPSTVAAARPPVCVDFGSMAFLGLLPRPQLLVAVLRAAAQRLRRHVVLLTAGWQPLLDACSNNVGSAACCWAVCPVERPVAHDALLPHCAALLHHGGAGSVAACLRNATPQLVCAFHFDQHQWAERIEWLGCGRQLSPSALLQAGATADGATPAAAAAEGSAGQQEEPVAARQASCIEQAGAAVAEAITALLQDANVQQQCAAMQQQLAGEDGLSAAVQLVRQQLQRQPWAGSAATAVAPPAQGTAHCEELVLPDGLCIQCLCAGEALFIHREIFTDDCYRLRGAFAPPPGSIVVDAGANIGLFCCRLLLDPSLGGTVERVYAFEPIPATADVLEANLRRHGMSAKVAVVRCGLHAQSGRLPFTVYPHMPGNSTVCAREKWDVQRPAMAALMGQAAADRCFQGASRLECPVVTLAEFVRQRGLPQIGLLKIDVEGCELEVLLGMDAACWAITHSVVAEVHDVGGRRAAVRALLEAHGFDVEEAAGVAASWLVFGQRRQGAA